MIRLAATEARMREKTEELSELQAKIEGLSMRLESVNQDLATANKSLSRFDHTVKDPVTEVKAPPTPFATHTHTHQ